MILLTDAMFAKLAEQYRYLHEVKLECQQSLFTNQFSQKLWYEKKEVQPSILEYTGSNVVKSLQSNLGLYNNRIAGSAIEYMAGIAIDPINNEKHYLRYREPWISMYDDESLSLALLHQNFSEIDYFISFVICSLFECDVNKLTGSIDCSGGLFKQEIYFTIFTMPENADEKEALISDLNLKASEMRYKMVQRALKLGEYLHDHMPPLYSVYRENGISSKLFNGEGEIWN